ncbi:O-antigen ligase family protein [Mucilaginibacter paludis]|uniref:O-antigen polymerase n=1 Tax=Mucilaginibacter paludis DSM 18603 TaxID=714943 RepID=H1Y3T4_9SPHI|nr:O-antigen ligase family protein [Mucilaginibacter paludis]EHQ30346.1 O-antigen polymerase [Mucilaginibacter paludis DSM 18603]
MEQVITTESRADSGSVAGRDTGLNIKSFLLALSLTLMVSVTSFLDYFKIREIFWAVELPPYLFCAMACFFMVSIISFRKDAAGISIIDVAILAFFFYSVVSAYILASPFLPVDRIYSLAGCIIYYSWIRLGFFRNGMVTVLYGILLVSFLQASWGLLQYFALLPSFAGRPGIQGGFINPGIYGCFMAVGLIIGLYLAGIYRGPKLGLILLAIANLIIAAALVFSLSRTAYVAAISGICLLLFFSFKDKIRPLFIRFWPLLTVIIAAVFAALAYYLWQRNTLSVSGRFLIWKISARMFTEHPLWGIGYGNFFTEYGNYQAAYFQSGKGAPQEIQTAGLNYYPFNELLRVAIENGIIGLGLFISAIVLACIQGWRSVKAKVPNAALFTTLLIVILVFGMFSYPFQSAAINCVFYFSIAVIASGQKPLFAFRFSRMAKVALFIPACLLLLLCLQKINALLSWRKIEKTMLYSEGDAFRQYEKTYRVLGNNGAFLFNYGAELGEMGINDKSLQILSLAKRYLSDVELSTRLAMLNSKLHQEKQAEQYYLTAAYMDPKRFVPLDNLFIFYQNTRQTQKAQNMALLIINKPVKVPSAKIAVIKNAARQYLQNLAPVDIKN